MEESDMKRKQLIALGIASALVLGPTPAMALGSEMIVGYTDSAEGAVSDIPEPVMAASEEAGFESTDPGAEAAAASDAPDESAAATDTSGEIPEEGGFVTSDEFPQETDLFDEVTEEAPPAEAAEDAGAPAEETLDGEPEEETPDESSDEDEEAVEEEAITANAVKVTTFTELKDLIENGTEEIEIVIDNSIQMEATVTVPQGRKVTLHRTAEADLARTKSFLEGPLFRVQGDLILDALQITADVEQGSGQEEAISVVEDGTLCLKDTEIIHGTVSSEKTDIEVIGSTKVTEGIQLGADNTIRVSATEEEPNIFTAELKIRIVAELDDSSRRPVVVKGDHVTDLDFSAFVGSTLTCESGFALISEKDTVFMENRTNITKVSGRRDSFSSATLSVETQGVTGGELHWLITDPAVSSFDENNPPSYSDFDASNVVTGITSGTVTQDLTLNSVRANIWVYAQKSDGNRSDIVRFVPKSCYDLSVDSISRSGLRNIQFTVHTNDASLKDGVYCYYRLIPSTSLAAYKKKLAGFTAEQLEEELLSKYMTYGQLQDTSTAITLTDTQLSKYKAYSLADITCLVCLMNKNAETKSVAITASGVPIDGVTSEGTSTIFSYELKSFVPTPWHEIKPESRVVDTLDSTKYTLMLETVNGYDSTTKTGDEVVVQHMYEYTVNGVTKTYAKSEVVGKVNADGTVSGTGSRPKEKLTLVIGDKNYTAKYTKSIVALKFQLNGEEKTRYSTAYQISIPVYVKPTSTPTPSPAPSSSPSVTATVTPDPRVSVTPVPYETDIPDPTSTPTPTPAPYDPTVNASTVVGLENAYVQGEKVAFGVTGAGMTNYSPNHGDYRYVPYRWRAATKEQSIEQVLGWRTSDGQVQGTFKESNTGAYYGQTAATTNIPAGSYPLTIVFQVQRWDSTRQQWVTTGYAKKVEYFTIVNGNGGNSGGGSSGGGSSSGGSSSGGSGSGSGSGGSSSSGSGNTYVGSDGVRYEVLEDGTVVTVAPDKEDSATVTGGADSTTRPAEKRTSAETSDPNGANIGYMVSFMAASSSVAGVAARRKRRRKKRSENEEA